MKRSKENVAELDKFGDISVGDVVSLNGSSYVLCNDIINDGKYEMENTEHSSLNQLDLTRSAIERYIKDGLKLETKMNLNKYLKISSTLINLSDDKKVDDIIKMIYYIKGFLFYYHPLTGKLYNFNMSSTHIFLEDAIRISGDVLNYTRFFSKDEMTKILKETSIDRVNKIGII